jgi:hypothetical protein
MKLVRKLARVLVLVLALGVSLALLAAVVIVSALQELRELVRFVLALLASK